MWQTFAPGWIYILIFANICIQSLARYNFSAKFVNVASEKLNRAPENLMSGKGEIHGFKINRPDKELMGYLKKAKFVVYRADIELALGDFLYNEIYKSFIIAGDDLKVFQNFIDILIVLNPLEAEQRAFLQDLRDWLGTAFRIFGYEVADWTECWEERFGQVFYTEDYVGCHGSEPHMRGYPCAMWQLFHFLTVQQSNLNNADFFPQIFKSTHVVKTITSFVKSFYARTCEKCADNFLELVEKKGHTTITDPNFEIFWLWELHNDFNNNFGELGSDPAFGKNPWPTEKICPRCYKKTRRGKRWHRDRVLQFLKRVYQQKNQSLYRITPNETYVKIRRRASAPSSESKNCETLRSKLRPRGRFRNGGHYKIKKG